jgi:hypothetical protein
VSPLLEGTPFVTVEDLKRAARCHRSVILEAIAHERLPAIRFLEGRTRRQRFVVPAADARQFVAARQSPTTR